MTSELSVSTAKAPFDRIDADVILLSSDNVEFWVFKVILSLSSPVFESMFWANGSKTSRSDTSAPTFKVPESSTTIETLLRFIYPTTTYLTLQSYDDAKPFLEAIAKYKVTDIVLERAKHMVSTKHMEKHFMSIYALSCRYRWKDLALAAARESLRLDILHDAVPYVQEMEEITAASYHRLLLYHRACGTAARDADSNQEWFPPPYLRYSSSCNKCNYDSGRAGIDKYRTACKAMLLRRPSPSTILDAKIPDEVATTWFEKAANPCKHRPQYFQEFRSAYAAEVERVISKVELEFP
ncbi:hypothetical protein EDD16DRAFT_1591796 [Pisolithus croceorrhizus]|nr:hypothetical protein EDD16DRAFT_1591796 [Pisolithus croceorrhizus]